MLYFIESRIVEWFGLERTLKITEFQPPAIGRDTSLWTRLFTAPSSLALNASREGAFKASVRRRSIVYGDTYAKT